MPAVDRNVLRIGVWELRWADDVPAGVAISEAVELAQDLSTDGSPSFVNGLLAKVATIGEAPAQPAVQDAPAQAASPGLPAGAEPSSSDGPAGGDEGATRAARPPARSAGLVRPRISSVLRPAPDSPEAETDPED